MEYETNLALVKLEVYTELNDGNEFTKRIFYFLFSFSNSLYKELIYGWDRISACRGAASSRYQSISDLTQHMIKWNEAWPQHCELHALPFSNSVWVLIHIREEL